MEIKVKRIHKDAKLPCYGHVGDAGLDLFSVMECVLKGGEARAISTGIQVAVPDGYVGLIWDKSGISLQNIHRLAGVVDSGYRGEIKVVLANLSKEAFSIEKGRKIAQMLIQPIVKVKVVDSEVLDETSRGENGFGSTGKY
jgi:dUTP pyrophosphatase